MRARIASLLVVTAVGLAGLVATPPAAAAGTVDITSPVELSAVSGTVEVAIASDLPSVQIESPGPLGDYTYVADVPVVDGVATWTWRTWGWRDGSVYIRATGCPTDCGLVDHVVVSVANTAAVLHKPAGTTFSGAMTFTAEAPEGGVLFRLGALRVYDPEPPYSATVSTTDMPDGLRTGYAQRCASRDWCGNLSAPVTWTVSNLHPSIASQPQPFSPDGDGVQDTASLGYRLPTSSAVVVEVRSEDDGTTVRGPVSLGTKAAGSWTWTWKGLRDDGSRAPEGRYRIVVATQADGRFGKAVSTPFALDTSDPVVSDVIGDSSFYPVVDGYRDLFVARATTDDRRFLTREATLVVRNAAGALIRRVTKPTYGDGVQRVTWNGRTGSGALVPSGSYTWRLAMRDAAGNVGYGPVRAVRVSHRRAVERIFVVEVPASTGTVSYSEGVQACASTPTSSFGSAGLRLRNNCVPGVDPEGGIEAAYTVALPAADSYLGLRVEVYGRTHLSGSFYGWVSPDASTRVVRSLVAGTSSSWMRFVDGSGYARADRTVRLGLGVRSGYQPRDLDAKALRLTVYAHVLV